MTFLVDDSWVVVDRIREGVPRAAAQLIEQGKEYSDLGLLGKRQRDRDLSELPGSSHPNGPLAISYFQRTAKEGTPSSHDCHGHN
jgi:hypothetical protein